MKIVILAENTTNQPYLGVQHGLSVYIETSQHRLLFDVGADDLFLKNAQQLGIDISQVDYLIISHGHYDHGGGLEAFLQVNHRAKIYVHERAFIPHLYPLDEQTYRDIGLAPKYQYHPQVILVRGNQTIAPELTLISMIHQSDLVAASNLVLLHKTEQGIQSDDFFHEQSLLMDSPPHRILITGCSHRGIVNIVEQVRRDYPGELDFVLGGFHLYNPGNQTTEPPELIAQVGQRLQAIPTKYYTCHCTGLKAYTDLKAMLQDQLDYAATGDSIILK